MYFKKPAILNILKTPLVICLPNLGFDFASSQLKPGGSPSLSLSCWNLDLMQNWATKLKACCTIFSWKQIVA